MIDDSRLYIKEEYVAINKKFENDYVSVLRPLLMNIGMSFKYFMLTCLMMIVLEDGKQNFQL